MGDYNGCYVTNISTGDYIKVRNVDFGEAGAQALTAKVRVEKKCTLVVRIGSKGGTIKGRLTLEPTDGEWQEVTCDLTSPINGVRDIFFTFTGSGTSLFDFDSWQFSEQPTHISHIAHPAQTPHPAYNLSGLKATSNTKGVTIVNGKKILK